MFNIVDIFEKQSDYRVIEVPMITVEQLIKENREGFISWDKIQKWDWLTRALAQNSQDPVLMAQIRVCQQVLGKNSYPDNLKGGG